MIGECYHDKFHPIRKQCKRKRVVYSHIRIGNLTDKWTWCKQHLPYRAALAGERGEETR